jgi:hypothetical protein
MKPHEHLEVLEEYKEKLKNIWHSKIFN